MMRPQGGHHMQMMDDMQDQNQMQMKSLHIADVCVCYNGHAGQFVVCQGGSTIANNYINDTFLFHLGRHTWHRVRVAGRAMRTSIISFVVSCRSDMIAQA